MNRIMSGLLATTLSLSFAAAEIVPVNAQPTYVPLGQGLSSNIETVQYEPWRKRNFNRNFSRNRDFSRRDFSRRNFARNDGSYWRGHRGSREWRRGYRRHGDYWFPLAAFATGALITGAIINNQNRVYRGDAHVQWCYNRYRSYRAYDNTFQPYNGPRQQCYSPY
ncbi:BA14K family protein [Mesorhizobium sp. YC-39]|uniref:BA14K family protein n=1 Tax=unclassified Mesorhizobium TaxID=325217 RepID=UPI0021E94429|nr:MULTISPECIES: BA14K family protein [unclassified Mesorhizobium]MCV3208424.1 BA14K family protein [Mesorhizobium sp. YC-2]MCV3232226.1 BA14K family protein [Mesorhizobium sp. YC-39]